MAVATLHAPLDAVDCLEVLVLQGISAQIRCVAKHLIGTKGVMHGKLFLTVARPDLPEAPHAFECSAG